MKDALGIGIVGLGAFLPEHVRTNDWWPAAWRERHAERERTDLATGVDHAARARSADVDPEVAEHSVRFAGDLFRGTVERRVIDDEHVSSDMEAAAARAALADAGLAPGDVDVLIVYSQVPDFPSPANHGLVAHKLGLRADISAMTLDVGCASFLPQLTMACRLIQTDEAQTVLVVVSSAMSRITDWSAPSSVNTGDGAVAAVLQRVEPGFGFIAQSQLVKGALHGGLCLVPDGDPDQRWYDAPGRLTAQNVDRAATHHMGAHAASLCREVCDRVLDKAEATMADVDYFALAHATAWFPDALGSAIGMGPDKRLPCAQHYALFGHLLPASAALNLHLSRQHGRLRRGDNVLIYSPGAGFTQAAMLYRWNL